MRPRVSVYLGVSLDLRIARDDGGLDWLERYNDPAVGDYGYAAFMESVDTLVMGRSTFDTVLGFGVWPFSAKRVVVFTNRPLEMNPGVETASGSLVEVLQSLHARGARHVYLDGGKLVQQGLAEGVVDALTLSVVPHLLGSGRPLFTNGLPELTLQLVGSQPFPTGLVQLRYQRVGAAPGTTGVER